MTKSPFAFIVILFIVVTVSPASAQVKPAKESALDRFLRYVKIDTQSKEDQEAVPSTKKQFNLANLLAGELKDLGTLNVRVSDYAIVYATVPGNLGDNSKAPVIGLIAHMDTSPAVSGENVVPIIHKNYQGGDIVLPKDPTQVISVAKNPLLKEMVGDDIITADGTTLLGSDDKSGVAEIMTMIDTLAQNPQIKHGTIAIAFTPDEEVGAVSRNLTSRASGPGSLTQWTAKTWVRSVTRPGARAQRASLSMARARIREHQRAS